MVQKLKRKIIIVFCMVLCSLTILVFSSPQVLSAKASNNLIRIATNEIGETEVGGRTKYGAAFGAPYSDWCNFFVLWCAKQAGLASSVVPGSNTYSGNCYTILNNYRRAGLYYPNDGSYTPKQGDLVFYNTNKSSSGSNHIGFVVQADSNSVTTIEGNVTVKGTRGVGKNVRPRYSYVGHMIIIGFASPQYDGADAVSANAVIQAGEKTGSTTATQKKQSISAKTAGTTATAEMKTIEVIRSQVTAKKTPEIPKSSEKNPIKLLAYSTNPNDFRNQMLDLDMPDKDEMYRLHMSNVHDRFLNNVSLTIPYFVEKN